MDALKTKGQMYDQIDLGKIQKSGFDLSQNVKGTGRIGRIIPTRCQEVLPGDRMKGDSSAAVQFEPLAVPMLANMYVRQEHFYVPNRIVWKNWDKFFTGGEKLDYTTPPPTFSVKSAVDSFLSLLPPIIGFSSSVDNMPALQLRSYSSTVGSPEGYYVLNDDVDSSISWKDSMRGRLLWILQRSYQMDLLPAGVSDLLQPFYDVVRSYMDSLPANSEDNNRLMLFEPIQGWSLISDKDIQASGYGSLLAYSIAQSTDAYESVLARAIDNWMNKHSKLKYAYPMTDNMRMLVHALYDCYRQYVGTSSNLDYLSYVRLTPTDFFYVVYMSYLESIAGITDFAESAPVVSFESKYFSSTPLTVFALRANYAIWYNYYRDQLLELNAPEPSQEDTVTSFELFQLLLPRQRCWSKDTFTTALTSTGTGNVVVPVVNSGTNNYISQFSYYKNAGADANSVDFINADMCTIQTTNGDKIEIPTRFISGLSKSKETATNKTSMSYFSLDMLDACRRAQKWLQKALIYGNRPQDRLYTSWGVRSLDARLSLPECLSTSSQMVQLSVNTNNTTIQSPSGETMSVAGDKSANAYGYDKGAGFNRFCEEHGLIISFLTILPEATYPYSVKRGHSRLDKFDYPTPEFATLGMDAVYDSELCPCGVVGFNRGVFGYQGRYFDSKCNQDEEHGELQTSQNMYTFGRQWSPYDDDKFPKLNYQFVHCFPKLDMFVVEDSNADYFRYDIHHALAAERALPVCGMYL